MVYSGFKATGGGIEFRVLRRLYVFSAVYGLNNRLGNLQRTPQTLNPTPYAIRRERESKGLKYPGIIELTTYIYIYICKSIHMYIYI